MHLYGQQTTHNKKNSGADGKGIQCIAQFDSWNPISGILRMNSIS